MTETLLNTLPILVVEDNPMNQKLMRHQLRRVGLEHIVIVDNGQQALDWLAANDCLLVLADCQMPVIDGYEMTRRIRARERGRRTPIIAVSAGVLDGDRARCIDAGMDVHIAKPIQLDALRAALSQWVTLP